MPEQSIQTNGEALSRVVLYGLMALHVGGASATYIFGKAAAVGFDNPEVVTLSLIHI